jgi:diguanylate cyclase (GGDEF)-like protein
VGEPSGRDPGGVQGLLTAALLLAALVPVVSLLYLGLPWVLPGGVTGAISQGGVRVFVGANVLLGLLLVGALHLFRRRVEAVTTAPAPPAPVARPQDSEPGQGLQALLASDRTDEIGALMREFTRILEVLQVQASQVQDYAGRFEAINEELRNANLRLRELSLTDELTEVGNRRNFDVRIREEINRSTRFGHHFSLLLLDLDYFKKFNDEFGHPQGDAVLRGLGALMRSMCREGDVPCRVGGEEFAFILPETAKADGLAFAERMRRGVEGTIKCPDDSRPITISIGLAAFPEDGKSPEDIFRASDEALYESKNAGRNRVTAYTRK